MRRTWISLAVVVGLSSAWLSAASVSESAQPKRGPPRVVKKGNKRPKTAPKPKEVEETSDEEESEPDRTEKAEKAEKAHPVTDENANPGGPKVLETKQQGDGGVKTYKFGPVEVEGRLKSPQIVYFLRRVRAEFAAGDLGHRSFMRELSDTRRNPALK